MAIYVLGYSLNSLDIDIDIDMVLPNLLSKLDCWLQILLEHPVSFGMPVFLFFI